MKKDSRCAQHRLSDCQRTPDLAPRIYEGGAPQGRGEASFFDTLSRCV